MNNQFKRTIKVTANNSSRHFTIRCIWSDGAVQKYRTIPLSRGDFEASKNMTENDWSYFLRNTDDYYLVK